ncbi:MAG TPA: hypothetical protein VG096_10845 [Bryobacteraceae bacterium]|nr:hypothetical protein [Bryobacteraceae bacterium]
MIRFAVFALAMPLAAQWLHLPTPGIPRTSDGKPDLKAPAPRTTGGKPDFSGLWGKASDKYDNNIAADQPPGVVQPWAEALFQQRKKGFSKDSMDSRCLPYGPKYTITPYRQSRIIQTPGILAILNDDLTHREIFMDGRQLEKDPNPTWMGYSVGRWEGDTLVVESNGYNDKTWLDGTGYPHTESLRVTERYRRTDFGYIELQVTFDDPMVFTKPVSVPIHMALITDTEMIEYFCGENEKDRTHLSASAEAIDVKVPAEILKAYAGTYVVKEDDGKTSVVEIFAEENGLFLNYANQGKQKLDALSETAFSLTGTIYEFIRDGQKGVSEFRIKTAEGELAGVRRK